MVLPSDFMRITSLVVVSLAPIFDFAGLNFHVPANGLWLEAIATTQRTGSPTNNSILGTRILLSFSVGHALVRFANVTWVHSFLHGSNGKTSATNQCSA
jgi:hypothetical protein